MWKPEEITPVSIWSYTMDYETNEIVMNIALEDGQKVQLRAVEKDIKSMASWFDLARYLASEKEKEKALLGEVETTSNTE